MAELTVSQIIKLTLGLLVVVAVVVGASLYFKESVVSFFQGIGEDDNSTSGEVNLSGYVPENQEPVRSPVLVENSLLVLEPFI